MISIHIEAKDASELQFHVKALSSVFKKPENFDKVHDGPAPTFAPDQKVSVIAATEPQSQNSIEQIEPKKRGRKPKEQISSQSEVHNPLPPSSEGLAVSEVVPAVSNQVEAEKPYPSKEEATEALKSVVKKVAEGFPEKEKGMKEGMAIGMGCLSRFGASMVSEIKDSSRKDFIDHCKEVEKTGRA